MAGRDRTLFFAFFAAGALLILTLKGFDAPQFVVTAFPCALMLWYAAWLWDWENKRPRFDSTGDNLYYIGFLYTLTSLAHSLYRFNADPNDTETIVSNFGIAISTTILGMALRILLGQTPADDPAEIETAARLDLASSARKLRAELDYTIGTFHEELEKDFKDFRERLERGFDEAESGISRTFGHASTLQGVVEQFEKDMREVTGALMHQARALGQSVPDLKQFERAVAELDERVGAASGSLLKHADALDAGADAVRAALQLQADRLRTNFLQALLGPCHCRRFDRTRRDRGQVLCASGPTAGSGWAARPDAGGQPESHDQAHCSVGREQKTRQGIRRRHTRFARRGSFAPVGW